MCRSSLHVYYLSFQKGWLSFLSGIADNSLYPILLLDSFVALMQASGEESMFASGWPRTLSIMSMVMLLTYLNYRGGHYSMECFCFTETV